MNKDQSLFLQYVEALIIGFIAAFIIYNTFWKYDINIVHSILESLSLFIGVAIFLITWNTINEIPDLNHILGFAILAVVIFDACHMYLFSITFNPLVESGDLTLKFWYLARLTKVIALFLMSANISITKFNRWTNLIVTIIFAVGTSLALIRYYKLIFPFYTEYGFTWQHKVAEALIIILVILSLFKMRNKINDDIIMGNRHFFMALLIMISAQVILIFPTNYHSINCLYALILKIISYYFLYKSVFVSCVKYPYKMLEDRNKKLQEAYEQLERKKQEELRKENILLQQEKLALIGQMGAGIVHETRNYLTTIKGTCQLLESMAMEDTFIKYLKKISKSIDEIDNIISKFLHMSKPKGTEFEEVSIYDLVQSIESLVISNSFMKNVDVVFEATKEERYLLCDESQINQVFLNLCKNALEAMEGVENPKLIIETGYDEITNRMYIKVTDNGKGIDPEVLPKIGEAFYTTKKTGTGLGLYICKQIIKEHGGSMEIDSKPGHGTSFTIWLPCLDDEEEEEI